MAILFSGALPFWAILVEGFEKHFRVKLFKIWASNLRDVV